MFVDEAKISARLIHPNIVQVFEFAYQDGGYYIVMEPVEGIDMAWLLRRRLERPSEQLPPAFVAEVGRQACRGLDFAHTLTGADGKPLGIVHRDVTPPNIMVAWNGTVKILDFGIARAAEALRLHQSDAGMVKGKMSYVAPELLEGKTADARSDVFSLGVVLHELLSGQRLFVGENDFETLKLVQEMPIPPPSSRNPGVKPALDAVVMRALERDPAKRYQSAGEMGDELEDAGAAQALLDARAGPQGARAGRPGAARRQGAADAARRRGARRRQRDFDGDRRRIGARSRRARAARRPRRGRGVARAAAGSCPPSRSPACSSARSWARRCGRPRRRRWWSRRRLPHRRRRRLRRRRPPPPAPAPAATVRVALDSAPQGATVTGAAGPLGKTPLLLSCRARRTSSS